MPEGIDIKSLPIQKYAVSTTISTDLPHSPAAIQLTIRYIFNDWFPQSEWEYDEASSDFEWYEACSENELATCDIWVPIKSC